VILRFGFLPSYLLPLSSFFGHAGFRARAGRRPARRAAAAGLPRFSTCEVFMKRPLLSLFFFVFSSILFSQGQKAAIGDIIKDPQAFSGKLVALEGSIIRMTKGSGSFVLVELRDEEGNAIKVRTELASLAVGQTLRIQGRIVLDPLSGGPYIKEELTLFRGPLPDAPAPKSAGVAPPTKGPVYETPAPKKAPQELRSASSVGGMFGFCFNQAQGTLRDILMTQFGRLFTLIVHPTCSFSRNALTFSGRDGRGRLKASFVTTYSSLLTGEEKASWELLFDDEGNISDIRFLSDTSRFTNVNVLNQLKDRLIGFIQEQIQALWK